MFGAAELFTPLNKSLKVTSVQIDEPEHNSFLHLELIGNVALGPEQPFRVMKLAQETPHSRSAL